MPFEQMSDALVTVLDAYYHLITLFKQFAVEYYFLKHIHLPRHALTVAGLLLFILIRAENDCQSGPTYNKNNNLHAIIISLMAG